MSAAPWVWPGSVIVRVVDGDSVVARVTRDIGFHGVVTFEQRLRLARINTPPVATETGKAASRFVLTRTLNTPVDITTTRAYKYGDEWMAEVTLPDGTNLSDVLVALGFAAYWDGSGPRPGG